MNVLMGHDFKGLQAGVGFKQLEIRIGQVYFQCVDDVLFVIANQNVIHKTPPLSPLS